MRASRVKTGFHRIGVVLAGICVIVGATDAFQVGGEPKNFLIGIAQAAFFYLLAIAIGWVISGFSGEP